MNCLTERLSETLARFKRARPVNATLLKRVPAELSSYHAAQVADTVSLRALPGDSRRAMPAPFRGLETGFHFRSTESPLSKL